ncbi:MAG: hypothetical protein CVV42_12640 [Candidatus Riflebacteria bacterium HGW-Riflebacteria-2]|jgi:hypothetical protein|nr:MAG: hypothetical protein CVV42_12640 [Candidatus Riflebacteria bacterium HGW-Riflebacteria-2]
MYRLIAVLTVLFAVVCCSSPLSAQVAQPGVRMLHYPIGNDSHFLIRVVQAGNDDDYWYYRSRPVRIKDQRKGEWVSSYVYYNWQSAKIHYEIYAWGKLTGKAEALQKRFQIGSADKLRDLTFDEVSENPMARLICASAETGRVISGISAYRNWAQASASEMQKWQPLLTHLSPENAQRMGGGGRDLDMYSIFTGVSAIRETLQTDVNLGDRAPQIDRFCAANQRTITGAVEMYNMDHATMMDELDLDKLVKDGYLRSKPVCNSGSEYYGRDLAGKGVVRCPVHGDPENPTPDVDQQAAFGNMVKVSTLEGPKAPSHPWRKMIENPKLALPQAYSLIPADCAFVHFPSYTAFRKAFDFFDEWATALGTLSGGESGNSNFSIEKRIKDQLLLKTDMLTRLFADLALSDIVFVAEDPFIFEGSAIAVILKISNETLLREKLAMTAAEFRKENASISESSLTIGGRPVQAFTSPDYRFRSYRITAKGHQIICNSPILMEKIISVIDGKAQPLTEYLDLHYFYEHIEKNFAGPGRIFSFLSDAFIRKLIGPAYKIATKRRLDCIRSTLLQSHEIMVNGKLGADAQCPEGGAYEHVTGEIRCPRHRTFGRLTPVSELLPTEVTTEEAGSYKQFVAQYNQYFSQFFDPIGFVFTTEPEFRGRLLIMPLVENGVYSELQKNVRHQAMKPAPQLKSCVVKFGANLKAETLPVPGHWHSPQLSRRAELIRKWFTGCLWAQVADHPLLFQWDSNMMARGILSGLGGGRPGDFAALSPFLMSFFSPVMVALELTDAAHYQAIIDWLQMEIESSRNMRGFLNPEFSLVRLEEKGVEMYVLSFDLFAIRKTYYLTSRDGFLLVASKKELFFELDKPEEREKNAFIGNFNMVLYPKNIKLMRPDLLEIRARSQREACLENLKNIHFVASFRPDQFKSSYQILYGAAPSCPAGGRYLNELPVSCSVHGTISGGALKPVPDFFKGVGAISIQSFVNPEGFQSEVRFFPE